MASTKKRIIRQAFSTLMGKRLPLTEGQLSVKGLHSPIQILRDRWGIPHIYAQHESDLWFGLGFCQAQDRAFQLETLVRVGRGKISEWAGKKTVEIDRLFRRLGLSRIMGRSFAELEPSVQETLRSFACGVNEGVRVGLKKSPHEYSLLGKKPQEFTAEDTLIVLGTMCFLLPTNWDSELARLKILMADGAEALKKLECSYPADHFVTSPPQSAAGPAVDALSKVLDEALKFLGTNGGSNNWAISADRTKTGRPLLANDPHLSPVMPCHWYMAHLVCPEWSLTGAMLAGTPAIVSGHNGNCAWGMTAGIVDNTDLFIEEVHGTEMKVREGEGWADCEEVIEVINVKGGKPVTERVLITPRGPILSPAFDRSLKFPALSIKATYLEPQKVKGPLGLARVKTFEEFRAQFRDWACLPLNFVYADTKGNIGWQLVGLAPKRKKGWGAIPLVGKNLGSGWDGLLPYDELPHTENPKIGFVATANNMPGTWEDSAKLSVDWIDGYRIGRIQSELAARKDWDLESAGKLQMDKVLPLWREIREPLLKLLNQNSLDKIYRTYIDLMTHWDGDCGPQSIEAAIFEVWLFSLVEKVVRTIAPNSTRWAVGEGFGGVLAPINWIGYRRFGWLSRRLREDPQGTQEWAPLVAQSFCEAIDRMATQFGSDTAAWKWGDVRKLELRHMFGEVPILRDLFNSDPVACGGTMHTIAQFASDPRDPFANPLAIPELRVLIDVGNWDATRMIICSGQSGNPLSPHYDDMFPLWQRGETVEIPFSEAAVQAAVRKKLILNPLA